MNANTVNDLASARSLTVSYSPAPVPLHTPSGRFRFRVLDILRARKQPQNTLKGSESESALSMKMKGLRGISLDDAAEIAKTLGFPLAELVSDPDSSFYDLNAKEQRLVEAYRLLSKDEQDAFLTTVTLRQRQAPNTTGRKVAHAPRQSAHGSSPSASGSALSPNVRREITTAEAAINAQITRGQAPTARPPKPNTPRGHRGDDKPHAPTGTSKDR